MPTRERWTAAMAGLCLALLPAVFPPVPASLLPAAEAQPVLRIGAIPDQNPEKLNRLYGLVADELSQQLGVKVSYVPVTDYAAAVSAFRTGSLDLVWFGGLTGVQASLQKPGAQMLAQRPFKSPVKLKSIQFSSPSTVLTNSLVAQAESAKVVLCSLPVSAQVEIQAMQASSACGDPGTVVLAPKCGCGTEPASMCVRCLLAYTDTVEQNFLVSFSGFR